MLETQCWDYLSFFATAPKIHIPSHTFPFLANSVLTQPLLKSEFKNKNNLSHLYRAVTECFHTPYLIGSQQQPREEGTVTPSYEGGMGSQRGYTSM